MIDVWINNGSGWNVEGLINIKNKDQKCFLWCHARHIDPSKEHPEKI